MFVLDSVYARRLRICSKSTCKVHGQPRSHTYRSHTTCAEIPGRHLAHGHYISTHRWQQCKPAVCSSRRRSCRSRWSTQCKRMGTDAGKSDDIVGVQAPTSHGHQQYRKRVLQCITLRTGLRLSQTHDGHNGLQEKRSNANSTGQQRMYISSQRLWYIQSGKAHQHARVSHSRASHRSHTRSPPIQDRRGRPAVRHLHQGPPKAGMWETQGGSHGRNALRTYACACTHNAHEHHT